MLLFNPHLLNPAVQVQLGVQVYSDLLGHLASSTVMSGLFLVHLALREVPRPRAIGPHHDHLVHGPVEHDDAISGDPLFTFFEVIKNSANNILLLRRKETC